MHQVVSTKLMFIILDKHLWDSLCLFLWLLLILLLPLLRYLDKWHLLAWGLFNIFLTLLLRFTIIFLGNLLLFLFIYDDGAYISLIYQLIFIIINGLNVRLILLLQYFHLQAIYLLCLNLHWYSKLGWLNNLLWRWVKIRMVDFWLLKLLLDFFGFLSFSHWLLYLL